MQTYLVGGAVRDNLLGLPVKDRDFVVVGATVEQLLAQGFQQVGRHFPVFLHPKTQEEYALARTEKKIDQGHLGFAVSFSPDTTLEQDLIRRDLTINAIAKDTQGQFYDPFGGQQDLARRLLRHISPAFVEDPLRVLRVARFAACFHSLGFKIAQETLQLMTQISQSGELTTLSAERIWLETQKALLTSHPEVYFLTLHEVGALAVLFPELERLFGVPNTPQHHPEIDSGIHSMLVLQQASQLSQSTVQTNSSFALACRFAALCHDLGKGLTPPHLWPKHHGHEQRGIAPLQQLCCRLKTPEAIRLVAQDACQFHTHIHQAFELRPQTLVTIFNRIQAWRNPERLTLLLTVCTADTRGRTGFEQQPYPQANYVQRAFERAVQVDVKPIIEAGYKKSQIRDELTHRRICAVAQFKQTYAHP